MQEKRGEQETGDNTLLSHVVFYTETVLTLGGET